MAVLIVLLLPSYSSGQTDTLPASVYAEEDLYEDDPYFWSHTKETGINITPLVSRFVPFSFGEREPGVVGFLWKRYYEKRAFRFGFGARIMSSFDTEQPNFFYLSIGLERRYPLSRDKKLTYTSFWEAVAQAAEEEEDFLAGIAKGYGIEYHFTKRIFVGTQAQCIVGVGDGLRVEFRLPTDLFLHVRLY